MAEEKDQLDQEHLELEQANAPKLLELTRQSLQLDKAYEEHMRNAEALVEPELIASNELAPKAAATMVIDHEEPKILTESPMTLKAESPLAGTGLPVPPSAVKGKKKKKKSKHSHQPSLMLSHLQRLKKQERMFQKLQEEEMLLEAAKKQQTSVKQSCSSQTSQEEPVLMMANSDQGKVQSS